MTNNCANVMRKYASMNKQAGLGSILNALKNSKLIGIPRLMYGLKHNPKAVKSALLRARWYTRQYGECWSGRSRESISRKQIRQSNKTK